MLWQDAVIAVANVAFSIALILQVVHGFKVKKTTITYPTSVPTFIGLYAMSIAFFTLSLYISSAISFVTGSLWVVLFIQKLRYD